MKAHILLVDDDRHITEILRRALAYEGYTVDVAHRGDEAATVPAAALLLIRVGPATGHAGLRAYPNDQTFAGARCGHAVSLAHADGGVSTCLYGCASVAGVCGRSRIS